jgi:hypothetical protein
MESRSSGVDAEAVGREALAVGRNNLGSWRLFVGDLETEPSTPNVVRSCAGGSRMVDGVEELRDDSTESVFGTLATPEESSLRPPLIDLIGRGIRLGFSDFGYIV